MYSDLEVLNFMLSHVGAAPVSTVTNPLPDLASAQLRLKESMIWTQKRGWWFNKLLNQILVPDPDTHEITLPLNTLKIRTDYPGFVVARNGRVYDPYRASFEFEFTDSILADIVVLLDWEDLPGSAQDAVMYRAAQQMILHELEDTNKAGLLAEDVMQSYVTLAAEDLEIKQRHTYSTPAVLRFMRRVRPYRRGGGSSFNPIWPGGGLS